MSSQPEAEPCFEGLAVLDLASGFTGALLARLLGDLGAEVLRVQPPGRDPFAEDAPAYAAWRSAQSAVPYSSPADLAKRIAAADVCLLGGDDHPELDWSHDVDALAAEHPRVIFVQITGSVPSETQPALPAHELLAQARAGTVSHHLGPAPSSFGPQLASYGAVMHALTGMAAALTAAQGGRGEVVSTSLVQGVTPWMSAAWVMTERPHPMISSVIPLGARWPIYECADGGWITYAQGIAGSKPKIDALLGIESEAAEGDGRWHHTDDDPESYFGVTEQLRDHVRRWPRDELVAALVGLGVAAEAVNPPGACWDDPQVRFSGLIDSPNGIETVGNPIRVVEAGW